MSNPKINLAKVDPVWSQIRNEAERIADGEPALAALVHSAVLHHEYWNLRWGIVSR